MSKEFFVQQELTKRGIGTDWTYFEPEVDAQTEYLDDSSVEALVDEFLQEEDEQSTKGPKTPHRIQLEQEFMRLYKAYMQPEAPLSRYREQFLLEDLFVQLRKLNEQWVHNKTLRCQNIAPDLDAEMALQIGCSHAYEKMMEDKKNGRFVEHAVAYYSKIAHNKAIDHYFRKQLGRYQKNQAGDDGSPGKQGKQNKPIFINIEDLGTNSDGENIIDRFIEFGNDPFAEWKRPYREREAKSSRLAILYFQNLMDYPYEPQKPLAVMYGSCLFQLAKELVSDHPLILAAKKSTVLASSGWAFQLMGPHNLKKLSQASREIVSRFFDKNLSWGRQFVSHMAERTDDGLGYKWGDIVYTQTYTKEQTSNWIESVSKSTAVRAARAMQNDRDMVEYATETFGATNRLRKALDGISKEESR